MCIIYNKNKLREFSSVKEVPYYVSSVTTAGVRCTSVRVKICDSSYHLHVNCLYFGVQFIVYARRALSHVTFLTRHNITDNGSSCCDQITRRGFEPRLLTIYSYFV